MSQLQTTGVLLAAGRGGRMGGRKQLVPWPTVSGEVPLIGAAYDAIKPLCGDMVVVLGAEADLVATALGERAFRRVECECTQPMFESIRAGLSAAQRIDPQRAVILHPADHPQVAWESLVVLANWTRWRPDHVIIPEYEGRGGHPILIPAAVAARLITESCPKGLGEFWKEHPELCLRIPVSDPYVVWDIDTPDDLLR
ncbi:MAG: NTP transferase domain-containing protein [Pirellulales bacterium]